MGSKAIRNYEQSYGQIRIYIRQKIRISCNCVFSNTQNFDRSLKFANAFPIQDYET